MAEFTEEWLENYYRRKGKELGNHKKPKQINKSKYGNKKTKVDGVTFDSKKESEYYSELKMRLMGNDIKGFCRQPQFILVEGNAAERAITYKADFIIFHNDESFEVVDVKGYETQQWKRTKKLFNIKFPDLKLTIIK